jgi:hypothetical protein
MMHLNGIFLASCALLIVTLGAEHAAAQQVRIAELGMGTGETYTALSTAVAGFDIVAADGIKDPGAMEKVLGGLDEGWGAAVSRGGGFGFIFSEKLEMKKDLGTYPGKSQRANPPYGVQFWVPATRFTFNLVVCRGTAETSLLASVHRYYEELTGNHGITLLLISGQGSRSRGERLFASPALRPRIREAGVVSSTLHPAWVVLNTRS